MTTPRRPTDEEFGRDFFTACRAPDWGDRSCTAAIEELLAEARRARAGEEQAIQERDAMAYDRAELGAAERRADTLELDRDQWKNTVEDAIRERDEARTWSAKVEAAFGDAQRDLGAILSRGPDEKLDDAARRVVAERDRAVAQWRKDQSMLAAVEADAADLVREVERWREHIKTCPAHLMRAVEADPDGLRAALPPLPPEGSGLPRYGLRWNGPERPVPVPMKDGYWTPYHLAAGRVAELEGALAPPRTDNGARARTLREAVAVVQALREPYNSQAHAVEALEGLARAIPVPPERPAKLDPEKQGGLAHCLEAAISAEEAKAALWDAGIGRDQLGAALDRCREDVRGPVDAGAAPAPAEPVKAEPDPRDEAVRLGYVLCDIRSMALASTADPSRYLPGLERIYAMAHDAIHTEDAILGWPPEQRPADVRADWQTRGRALYRAMVALGDLLDDESTKTYEERYQIAVDVYVATGAWLEIDPGARPAVVGAAPEDPVPGEHRWLTPDDRAALGWAALAKDPWTTCRWCGAVRQSSGKNKPCRGRVGLTLREAHQRPRKLTREQLLDSDPQALDLTVRVSNGLSMAGIKTVREIVGMTRAQVEALPHMGAKGARDLGAVLAQFRLAYREDERSLERLADVADEEARKLGEVREQDQTTRADACVRCGHLLMDHRDLNRACWSWVSTDGRAGQYCQCACFVPQGAKVAGGAP